MKIDILQIYYKEEQAVYLDSDFITYDNIGKVYPNNFEYAVFFDLYAKTDWKQTNLAGTVSWKFGIKTGLTGSEFKAFIKNHPGFDCYFVNPFPELAIYHNVWEQGQVYHRNLVKITKDLFLRLGYSPQLLTLETPPKLTTYCNYFVGNKAFWDEYICFLMPIWKELQENNMGIPEKLDSLADLNINAPYAPFIFERLLSTFLTTRKFKTISMPIKRGHRKVYRFLGPLWRAVNRLGLANSHQELRTLDYFLIWIYVNLSILRSYRCPLFFKALSLGRIGKGSCR